MAKIKWPLSGKITSPFGDRTNRTSPHSGTDIYGPTGSAISAGAAGKVHHAGPNRYSNGKLKPSGNVVTIEYPVSAGILTAMYCHVAPSYPVSVGRSVKAGQVIGYVGTSGNSKGGHTHIECYLNGKLVNPEHYFGGTVPSGGGTTPIETDEDMAHMELVQTPDGTVWFCYDRIIRYAIPNSRNLSTYVAHLKALGKSTKLIQKSATDIAAYGSPVYADPLTRFAEPKDVAASTSSLLAAIGKIQPGTGTPAPENPDLGPALGELATALTKLVDALK